MFTGHPLFAKRTLILGTDALARELVEAINHSAFGRYEIVGAIGESRADEGPAFPCPVLGSINDLELVIVRWRPERIVVALTERRRRLPARQLVAARVHRHIVVEDGQEVYERLTGKLALDSLTPSSVVFSQDFRPHDLALAVSRGLSVLAAIAGLIALAPFFALIALAIKLESRGPVLFIQNRVGRRGRRFRMLKFRTMRPVDTQRSEWVGDNGDRITCVGAWLRRFRFDEIPQLVNILRGDMNLVGPRPHPATNVELFTLVSRNAPQCGAPIPYYELRSMIRPGITGWAQVRYRYANNLDEEMQKMRYDLYYIKHHSVWLDLYILLETIRIVLLGHKSGTADAQARTSHERRTSARAAGAETPLSGAARAAPAAAAPEVLQRQPWPQPRAAELPLSAPGNQPGNQPSPLKSPAPPALAFTSGKSPVIRL